MKVAPVKKVVKQLTEEDEVAYAYDENGKPIDHTVKTSLTEKKKGKKSDSGDEVEDIENIEAKLKKIN